MAAEGSAAAEGSVAAEGAAAPEGSVAAEGAAVPANLGRRRVLLQEAEGEQPICSLVHAPDSHAAVHWMQNERRGWDQPDGLRSSCMHCDGGCPPPVPPTRPPAAALGDGSVNVYNGCFPGFKDVEGAWGG